MDVSQLPSDFFVHEDAFTQKTYRDVYPAIDPTRPELSQAGKVVVITGASRGIGKLVRTLIDPCVRAGS